LVGRLLAALSEDRPLTVAPAVMQAFARYGWPGNIRQLAQTLRVAVAMLEDDEQEIQPAHLPEDLALALQDPAASPPQPLGRPEPSFGPLATPPAQQHGLRSHARAHAREVLAESGGNVSEAARRLGIGRNTLYRLLSDSQ